MFQQVAAPMPGDTLSAKLARQLGPPKDQSGSAESAATAASAPLTADTTPPEGASIAGTWLAQPVADAAITLTTQAAGGFTWQVTQKGKTRSSAGTSPYGEGILTLVPEKGPVLVGRVVGDGPDDRGLSFSK